MTSLAKIEQDERDNVELPLIAQLVTMGWEHTEGDKWVAAQSERSSFAEVVLRDRLRSKLIEINRNEHAQKWLTPVRADEAIAKLVAFRGATGLLTRNRALTEMLLTGVQIAKDPSQGEQRDPRVHFIDFDDWAANDFLAVNQFRVNRPGSTDWLLPDVVLFVNGIPIVVIECKSRHRKDPLVKAIDQLRRYANQRKPKSREGIEKLFDFNQLTIATSGDQARLGTFTAGPRHYGRWRTTEPGSEANVLAELGTSKLTAQQTLVAGVLRPAHLLDIVRNFVIFNDEGDRVAKIGPRYQQFRAVNRAVERLQTGKSISAGAKHDERGGVIWQTQGSGKSLAMVFLVRKMRNTAALRGHKIVFITDRRDLEGQLLGTARLTGETLSVARPQTRAPKGGVETATLTDLLKRKPPGLIFATIQKYRGADEKASDKDSADGLLDAVPEPLNTSDQIVVLADEAHRSHTSALHARLRAALPNAAHIGFTGTPILDEDKRKTTEIFGPFIDQYTLKESEEDGATVPITYEGRHAVAVVEGATSLDAVFSSFFAHLSQKERDAVVKRYATEGMVSEATEIIRAKARDMLIHYVETAMPDGFKAMVVASSRIAAVRYQEAFTELIDDLVVALDGDAEALTRWEKPDDGFLDRAALHLDRLKQIKAAAVISGAENDPPDGAPDSFVEWSDPTKTNGRITSFKKSIGADGGDVALLCVKSMLLTGFDAPIAQVMYLDRAMKGAELLQAIARVNRSADNKSRGFVVDYVGIAATLEAALALYRGEKPVKGASNDSDDELTRLEKRHARALALFSDRKLGLDDEDACVDALVEDAAFRADFADKFKDFARSLADTLPQPKALAYLGDAKRLGKIALRVRNLTRDDDLALVLADAAPKVRALIDEHVKAQGVDPTIAPVDLTDPAFAKEVDERKSPRAKAQVMEHAIRDYLTVLEDKHPARAIALSERLEEIIEKLADRWDELLDALVDLKDAATTSPSSTVPGLSAVERPFYELIVLRASLDGTAIDPKIIEATQKATALIRSEIAAVDFWRSETLRDGLRNKLVQLLDGYIDDFTTVQQLGDDMRDLAHRLHEELLGDV
ncbi:hypothetical protein DSM112329_03213 [Paraconexibacter sp. AEG42_29]|uniref:Type I restriction enzyme endonuclease subunit n=1 Tax=Paraconexibacter sp. AEG42_29 TaxID=2997339 RepID=A0AAU7AXI2_9ACTN